MSPMSTATERLQKYLDAETSILAGQEVRLNGRALRRADLQYVQQQIKALQRQVNSETRTSAGGSSTRYLTPDFSE